MLSFLAIMLFWACKSSNKSNIPDVKEGEFLLDASLVQNSDNGEGADDEESQGIKYLPNYNASETHINDLIHTKAEVKFDWNKSQLIGKATLTLKPYFYPTDSLTLDAKGFDINTVNLQNAESLQKVNYNYDDNFLKIQLGKTFTRQDTYKVVIEYIAKPNEIKQQASNVITDARGLYFINPLGKIPNKPKHLWTQGETEATSCWLPTIDTPNERCTQELYMTVDTQYVTLSNGKLVSSSLNMDGTRTDYWKQNKPHAPYLFMMFVGDFEIVKDHWGEMEVNYYVEKKFAPYAKMTFGNTPEMIEFFSNTLGVKYPWDKYSQVVVRDFVSGAMENTSAVVHYDALNQYPGDHIDHNQDEIICHELFHHWFGDLVTCESWANLPLNESFATYGEYLWFEHKYGKDLADKHAEDDLSMYMMESKMKKEPLIRYGYKFREDMFDAHSYQKGGLTLHMLRNYVGDDAFFKSLQTYLNENAYQSVEIHQLRLAFEKVTGKDMNWFFNQWFLTAGHPELEIEHSYENGKVSIHIQQTQDMSNSTLYRLPAKIQFTQGSNKKIYPVEIVSQDTTLVFDIATMPDNIIFDSDKILVAKVNHEKPVEMWINQLKFADNYRQKSIASSELKNELENEAVFNQMFTMLDDKFSGIRSSVLRTLQSYSGEQKMKLRNKALDMLKNDPSSTVRAYALNLIENQSSFLTFDADELEGEEKAFKEKFDQQLKTSETDSSYLMQTSILQYYQSYDDKKAMAMAKKLKNALSNKMKAQAAEVFISEKDSTEFDFVTEVLQNTSGVFNKVQMISSYGSYLNLVPKSQMQTGLEKLTDFVLYENSNFVQLIALQSLKNFDDTEEGLAALKSLYGKVDDKKIKMMLSEYMED